MAVDVVVVNYKTNDLLADFVNSYEKHKFDGCTLTVVDIEPAMSLADPLRYTYKSFTENVGYSKACNVGASYGTNDVILLANADTVLSEGLEECYNALIGFDDWGCLGPRQVNDQNQITAGGVFGHTQSPKQRSWLEPDHGQCNDVREDALTISGALYFVKRSVWNELTSCPTFQQTNPGAIGAFLDTPHYYEETFCSYHMRAHGYRCVFYGAVKMVHYWHRASPAGGWADQQMARSRDLHRAACATHGIPCE